MFVRAGSKALNQQVSQISNANSWRKYLFDAEWVFMDYSWKYITTENDTKLTVDQVSIAVLTLLWDSTITSSNCSINWKIINLWVDVNLRSWQFQKLHKLFLNYKSLKELTEKYELEAFQSEFNKLGVFLEKECVDLLVALDWRDTAWKWWVIDRLNFRYNRKKFEKIAPWIPTKSEIKMDYFERYLRMMGDIIVIWKRKKWFLDFKHKWNWRVITYDRSWYNYMYIWKVLWFCSEENYNDYLKRVLDFEELLSDRAFNLHKFYLSITKETQFQRLTDRENSALKWHKVSPTDWKAHSMFDEFTPVKEEVFNIASVTDSSINVVDFNDKHLWRLALLYSILKKYLWYYSDYIDLASELEIVNPLLAVPAHEIKKETI